MDFVYIKIIFFSFIQAITEFLPISSSGHLVLLHNIFTDSMLNNLSFDVALHGGSLLAIILYFFKDIVLLIKNFFRTIFHNIKNIKSDTGFLLIIGVIPAAFLGYYFSDYIENIFRSPIIVAFALILGSIILILAERFYKPKKDIKKINIFNSLFIGIMQCFALVPGISRSGMTISGGMFSGLSRKDSAKFSFLLAIPIIFGAFVKKSIDSYNANLDFVILFLGFIFSFLFSIFALRILMILLKKSFGLYAFAIYRIVLAIVMLSFFI